MLNCASKLVPLKRCGKGTAQLVSQDVLFLLSGRMINFSHLSECQTSLKLATVHLLTRGDVEILLSRCDCILPAHRNHTPVHFCQLGRLTDLPVKTHSTYTCLGSFLHSYPIFWNYQFAFRCPSFVLVCEVRLWEPSSDRRGVSGCAAWGPPVAVPWPSSGAACSNPLTWEAAGAEGIRQENINY